MINSSLLTSIAGSISLYFHNGIHAAEDVLSFAESTLGIADVNELARILSEADSYGEGLIDLVFSPDQVLRLSIEPLLPQGGLSQQEITTVSRLVLHDLKTATVLLGGADVTAEVTVTEQLIDRFILKLNFCKSLPFRNTELISDCLSDEVIASIRVLVRNSRYQSSPGRDRAIVSLINGLVRMTGARDPDSILDCLVQLIELFNDSTADSDLHSILSVKKHLYSDIIEMSAQFDEYISRYSMEFLMSKKLQPPAACVDEMRKKIYLIDLISTAVFGRPMECSPVDMTLHFEINDGNGS